MASWPLPLAKLVGLIILLPFTLTYLHLHYYTYWKNEYCLVGPHLSTIGGTPHEGWMEGGSGSAVGSEGNADNQLRGEGDEGGDVAQMYGIYAPLAAKKKKKNNEEPRQFRQIYAPTTTTSQSTWQGWSRGWPSITQAATLISSPSSQLSNHRNTEINNDDRVIAFSEKEGGKRWCLRSSSGGNSEDHVWCSEPLPTPHGAVYSYPLSGVWRMESPSAGTPSLSVSCPTPAISSASKEKSRHKQQNGRQNQNVQFLLNHPATTLLLLLNAILAFHYWNHRIPPSAVCKQYTKIVIDHEWWRGLTGATAHFEPLHIGFNMMSLNTLGRELEGGFGSVPFLVYNIALIVCTTTVMMGMVYSRLAWIQRRLDGTSNPILQAALQDQQVRLRETSTVGYSAVLFAWMVVSTMERTEATCPVPFFADVCFATYAVPGMPLLKVNVAPIVSLFVAQFIMPRVSFMGHLAGIVCGFCLHWGLLPPLEVCSPNVLMGGVFLIGLIWRRRVIPVRPLLTATMDEEGCVEHEDYLRSLLADGGEDVELDEAHAPPGPNGTATDPFMRSRQKKKEREASELRRKQRTLLVLRNLIGIVAISSLFVFGWGSSLVVSQCVLLAFFTFASQSSSIVWAYTRSKVESDIFEPEKARAGMIWRGFFMSAVLSVVVDSASVASWFVLPTLIAAEQSTMQVGLLPLTAFMTVRTGINLLALMISSKILHDVGIGGGLFLQVFSPLITWSKLLSDCGVFASYKPSWSAFEGRGMTLGR